MKPTLACSAALAAVIAFLVWLPGCGGGGEAPTPATIAKPPAATTPPAPAAPAPTLAPGAEAEEEEESPLLAWAESDKEDGEAPLTITFTADTEGGKAPLKYTWKFGDGTPDSTDKEAKHTFQKAGKYRVDLEVADSAGDSDSDYLEIEVR